MTVQLHISGKLVSEVKVSEDHKSRDIKRLKEQFRHRIDRESWFIVLVFQSKMNNKKMEVV
jgi:hypothetical protein